MRSKTISKGDNPSNIVTTQLFITTPLPGNNGHSDPGEQAIMDTVIPVNRQ